MVASRTSFDDRVITTLVVATPTASTSPATIPHLPALSARLIVP